MKWHIIPVDEQETLINIDYCEKFVKVWTSRGVVGKKIIKKIGKPDSLNTINGVTSDAEWVIPFNERKRIIKVLSIGVLLMIKK